MEGKDFLIISLLEKCGIIVKEWYLWVVTKRIFQMSCMEWIKYDALVLFYFPPKTTINLINHQNTNPFRLWQFHVTYINMLVSEKPPTDST